ncbi:MAG: STAS domain-containing protein [Actinobacteria bacterium]|nr:STAS domain-containing protein [Actinomycetota bacterium]
MPSTSRQARLQQDAFRIDMHPERTVVRVAPAGELDITTSRELAGALQELRDAGFDRVVLDLRRLTFIDSTAIARILTEDRLARTDGHDFTLIAGSRAIQRVLEICGIARLLRFESANGEVATAARAEAPAAAARPAAQPAETELAL